MKGHAHYAIDNNGIVLCYRNFICTVDANHNKMVIQKKMRPHIGKTHHGLFDQGVIFNHNIVPVNTAKALMKRLHS